MSPHSSAVLFPGQGAWYAGALSTLRTSYPQVNRVFAEVDLAATDLVGKAVSSQLLDPDLPGIEHLLEASPVRLQLAIYGVALATYDVLRAHGLRPDVLVGHSFGEIAALTAAGAFTIREGAEIVIHRTEALAESTRDDARMVALGVSPEDAERLTALLGEGEAVVAVENHARQSVVTGRSEALERLRGVATALRVAYTPVKSPYPFHSPWVADAAARFHERIAHLTPAPLAMRVHSPIEGRDYEPGDDLRELLASHLTRPVRFGRAVQALHDAGVDVFVESGALGGLTGIVERQLGRDRVLAIAPLRPEPSETAALASALDRLAGAGLAHSEPAGTADADIRSDLRAGLLPEVPADRFRQFWSAGGPELVGLVRRAYQDWERVAHPPTNGSAPPVPPPNGAASAVVANGSATSNGSHAPSWSVRTPDAGGEATTRAHRSAGRSEVLEFLVGMYAEALEYPAEVFAEATDLEAELGVDSVKQTELLARVSDHFGLPPTPDGFRVSDHNTLGAVADLVMSTSATEAPAASAPSAPVEPVTLEESAPAPATNGSAGANGSAGRSEVLEFLVGMYAEALEYPAEVFAEATDLEAELGVDSVKQTELLARVSDHFGLPPTPDGFRVSDHNTLGAVADLVVGGAR